MPPDISEVYFTRVEKDGVGGNMGISAQLIQPIMALVLWSMVMWVWMYATRIPAISKMNMKLDPDAPTGSQWVLLPSKVHWKADNYNHLMEQPTIFYATVLSLVFLHATSDAVIYSAWAYVGLRVVHSLIQVSINKIEVRFVLFVLSNIPLALLIYKATCMAFRY